MAYGIGIFVLDFWDCWDFFFDFWNFFGFSFLFLGFSGGFLGFMGFFFGFSIHGILDFFWVGNFKNPLNPRFQPNNKLRKDLARKCRRVTRLLNEQITYKSL